MTAVDSITVCDIHHLVVHFLLLAFTLVSLDLGSKVWMLSVPETILSIRRCSRERSANEVFVYAWNSSCPRNVFQPSQRNDRNPPLQRLVKLGTRSTGADKVCRTARECRFKGYPYASVVVINANDARTKRKRTDRPHETSNPTQLGLI